MRGDRLAFKQLYLSHYRAIFGHAVKFTRSAVLAEDIVQDVFLKIWENRDTMGQVRHFRSYLFTICKNMTLNMLARASREAAIMEQMLQGTQPHPDTETQLDQQEYERLLHEAIDQLPPQRRAIFRMCKLEGKSYDEAAAQMGVTAGTINDHIVKGTRAVKAYLRKYNINLLQLIFMALLK